MRSFAGGLQMATASPGMAKSARTGALLGTAVAERGSAAQGWSRSDSLLCGADSSRNLADLLHFLCILHGRYPGVVDHAAARNVDAGPRAWLAQAAYSFAGERAYLAKLAVAAGPVPGTPGSSASDAAVLSQRHAIDMLRHDRDRGISADLETVDRECRRIPLFYAVHNPGDVQLHRLAILRAPVRCDRMKVRSAQRHDRGDIEPRERICIFLIGVLELLPDNRC